MTIGKKHDASAAQVALKWLLDQDGVAAIPKASRGRSQKANLRFAESDARRRRSQGDRGVAERPALRQPGLRAGMGCLIVSTRSTEAQENGPLRGHFCVGLA